MIRNLALALSVIVLCFLCSTTHLHAASPVQLWHIPFTDDGDLRQLARELDVWEVDHAAHTVLAPLTPEEAANLGQTRALTLADDQSPLLPPEITPAADHGIPGFACYRTVDETFTTLEQWATDYPDLVELKDIGDSWDKTTAGGPPGDDMRVAVITNHNTPGPKFRFLLMGAIHAREYTTSELALRFAEMMLQSYGSDANATWLLDHGELHLLPYANPDGRRIAESGELWRKNTNTDAACTFVSPPSFTYGVDLNRNSSFHWNNCQGLSCSSADSCRETYRGVAPASEPEVAAIEAYLRTLFADLRGDTLADPAPDDTAGLFLSLHSYGRLVLFPWGWTTEFAPNAYGLATVARHFGYPLNYTVCQAGGAGCLYQTDGTTDDYAYGDLGVAAFTIEFGTAFFQSCTYFDNTILQPGLTALRYAFNVAPQPYVLAEGPEVLDLVVDPPAINAAGGPTAVTISATVDASRMTALSGNNVLTLTEPVDPISGAQLTVDQVPWQGTPFTYPLDAVDGSFDSVREGVTAQVEMACLPDGRHMIYLQGQDTAGDKGILAQAFVTVTNPSLILATVSEPTASAKPGETVTFTVAITNTGAFTTSYAVETDAASGVRTPAQPITLTPGAATTFAVVVTVTNETAGTLVPAVITVRALDDPKQCRQVGVVTQVTGWPYQQRLLYIAKN